MESTWIQLLQQLVTTLAGAAFVGLSTLAGFYVKRLTEKVQRKTLMEEISRYVKWAEQSPSFIKYTGKQKYMAVAEKAKLWGKQNDISLTDDELMILIESSVKDMKLGESILLMKSEELEEEKEELSSESSLNMKG